IAGERRQSGSKPVTGVARELLDGALTGESVQQPGGGALRKVNALGDVSHAERAVGEAREHREGAFDGPDGGHRLPHSLRWRCSIIRPRTVLWNPRNRGKVRRSA